MLSLNYHRESGHAKSNVSFRAIKLSLGRQFAKSSGSLDEVDGVEGAI
jgi:hypothetical protein